MEILNILYSNNLIAVYLIGAILVVIFIFIVISSMSTTPKDNKEILNDPTEIDDNSNIFNVDIVKEEKIETPEIPKINDLVEDLYQQSLKQDYIVKEEPKNLNSFLEEFEVPENVIEEVVNNDEKVSDIQGNTENELQIEIPDIVKSTETNKELENTSIKSSPENVEDMLKRLYDLRQNESNARKNALLNEIYDLKKQIDESLKSNTTEATLDYTYVDTKALADYYLFNEDIEFPKLK